MIPYKYLYLLGSLYFLWVWSIIFWRLPRYRFQLVASSMAFWIGMIAEYFWWTRDWWHPITMTGTRIGLEDLIMCFTHVGIPIFVYKFVFNVQTEKNVYSKRVLFRRMMKNFVFWFLVSFFPTLILIEFFYVHSFIATIIGMGLAGFWVAAKRKDLFTPMVWSAALMVAISFPIYWMTYLFPGIMEATWNFNLISGYKILGAPVEDVIWYAFLGFFLGGAYEYLFEFKLIKKPKI